MAPCARSVWPIADMTNILKANPMPWLSVWIGWDTREAAAFLVADRSLRSRLSYGIAVHGLMLDKLRADGLYYRKTLRRNDRLYDDISQHPMATEFAISRFLVPVLHKQLYGSGWALFMDCDMLVRDDVMELFALADDKYAVMCVKHQHEPHSVTKMDNQLQSIYARKNWSSVMLFNVDHPANAKLTVALVNSVPGRDLHRFCWLKDEEIGELGPEWNWLVGWSPKEIEPKICHFTEGLPFQPGYEAVPYADEWRQVLQRNVVNVF